MESILTQSNRVRPDCILFQNLAFSNQLYGKQNLGSEDIKEPLSKVEVQPPSADGPPQDVAPGECVA